MALRDRKTKRSFQPAGRVIILIDEQEEKYLKIEEFNDINTTVTINGINSCTISLTNANDKWFNKARTVDKSTKRQKEIVDYLYEVLSISELRERNFERTQEYYNLIKRGKIDGSASKRKTKYYEESNNGKLKLVENIPFNYADAYANYEYLALDFELMRRVWVDFKDRNGEWAPGFSGYISSIKPNYNSGQASILTLECKGILSLLQQNEIVLEQAIDPRYDPLKRGEQISEGFSALTNNLAGRSGEEIISTLLNLVRDFYCYNSGNTGSDEQTVRRQKDRGDYYYQEPLWLMKGDEYAGKILSNNIGYGNESVANQPIRNWTSDTPVKEILGKFIIDPEIVSTKDKRYEVFQKAIKTGFQLYQNKTEYAYNMCKSVANLVGYNFFEDPKGNIVFQSPKYDKLPRLKGDLGWSVDGFDFVDMAGNPVIKYTENYSNLPYHARDYILDHISLRNRRYSKTENGLVTFVTTHSLCNLITVQNETIKAEMQSGFTSYNRMAKINKELAEKLLALNRRYGVRRHDMKPMVTGAFGNSEFLDRWALQSLNQT